jgi:hypothetical protein
MRGTKAITDPLVHNNKKTMVLMLDSTHRCNKRKFLLSSPIRIIVKMPTYNENLPKCPGCQFSTNSNYQCRGCLCHIHWFCSVDPYVKEKGFSAFYLCKNCTEKKPSTDSGNISTMAATNITTKITENRQTTTASRVNNNSNLFQFGLKKLF